MNLLIIGAGGHGQCCMTIAERMKIFDKISFLDDDERYELSDIVVGKIEDLDKFVNDYDSVFVAIGNNEVRKKLYDKARFLGYKLPILIDPNASVSKYCYIGEGSVIFPCAVLETNCHVAKGCIISSNTTINREAYISDYVSIHSNSVIRKRAHIGESTLIEGRCVISPDIIIKPYSYISEGRVVNNDKEYAYDI